jgi:cellulose synthase/poly-beta-1,6-N-acetylglucosamine synthase-like glycosyltransferase
MRRVIRSVVRVSSYWEIIAWLGLAILILVSILANVTLLKIGDSRFVITLYGSIVIFRKILQQTFAYRHNTKMKALIWKPIFDVLREAYPADIDWLNQIEALHITYDNRRKMIQQKYSNSLGTKDQWRKFRRQIFHGNEPKSALVSPIYKVSFEEVQNLVLSVAEQSLPVQTMYLVVNGQWPERPDLVYKLRELVHQLNADPKVETRFRIIIRPEGGKRPAMRDGFLRSIKDGVQFVCNSDSDTFLDMDAVANAVWAFLQLPKVICLTGDVRIYNPNVNFLTLMTAIRYFFAFNIERAAQSLFWQMTCLSGPFLAYRTENLAQILDRWSGQKFLGLPCTFGDDRHMATLALLMGWGSIFLSEAVVWTTSPEKMLEWTLQQLRWRKSADRENWILAIQNRLKGLHWYIKFDLFYLTVFPILVAGAFMVVGVRAVAAVLTALAPYVQQAEDVTQQLVRRNDYLGILIAILYVGSFILLASKSGLYVLLPYIVIIIVLNVVFQGVYGWRLTGDRRYLFSFAYVYFMPYQIRFYIQAKIDAANTAWGTK